jgi:hypothetical protein
MISIYLNQFYPSRVALPCLREFHCFFYRLGSIWEIIPYLSPSIQKVQLFVEMMELPTLQVLALLSTPASKMPFLEQLLVDGDSDAYPSMCIMSTLLCGSRFIHLSTVECPFTPVSLDAVGHLARLPNLHKVSFILDDDSGDISTLAMPAQPFPSLRELDLSVPNVVYGIGFIRSCLPSVSLNSFEFFTPRLPSSGEIHQLFSALSSHLVLQSLTDVLLLLDHHRDHDVGPTLEFRDFEPLLQFNNLQSLHITTGFSPERLSDNLLVAMSLAWPLLTSLTLYSCLTVSPQPQCTFDGILYLAERCRSLKFLGIPFMASAQIDRSIRPGGGPVNRNLKELTVGKSPINDSRAVASLLLDVFPSLERIDVDHWYGSETDDGGQNYHRWEEVVDLYMEERVDGAQGT